MRLIQRSLLFPTDTYQIVCEECPAVVEGEDLRQAEAKARALGWTLGPDACPEHGEGRTMTTLSSLEVSRRALPSRLPEAPTIYEKCQAVRAGRDVLAGIVPVDLSPAEAEAIRRVAAESEEAEVLA